MHHAEPPFFHRVLSPSAFLVCRIKEKLKPLLINFDCVKDTDDNAEFSVFYAVNDKISEAEQPETIFAPELLSDEILDSDTIDWEKIDVYALGKTITKVLTNYYQLPHESSSDISAEQLQALQCMCSENPVTRSCISEIEYVF